MARYSAHPPRRLSLLQGHRLSHEPGANARTAHQPNVLRLLHHHADEQLCRLRAHPRRHSPDPGRTHPEKTKEKKVNASTQKVIAAPKKEETVYKRFPEHIKYKSMKPEEFTFKNPKMIIDQLKTYVQVMKLKDVKALYFSPFNFGPGSRRVTRKVFYCK